MGGPKVFSKALQGENRGEKEEHWGKNSILKTYTTFLPDLQSQAMWQTWLVLEHSRKHSTSHSLSVNVLESQKTVRGKQRVLCCHLEAKGTNKEFQILRNHWRGKNFYWNVFTCWFCLMLPLKKNVLISCKESYTEEVFYVLSWTWH